MSSYCDGMVHVVELHVWLDPGQEELGQIHFMRPIAVFDDEKTAWDTAKKGIIPEILNLAKELLEEDDEWRFLTDELEWDRLDAHVEDGRVEYYDDDCEYDFIVKSITVSFTKFEVPMNPAEL